MKSRLLFCILAIVAGATIFSACREGSGNPKKKIILPAGEVHEGWYFAAGDQVILEGTVNGDVYAAGGIVEIDGTVNGDLIVAGGQVTVGGTVSDNVRGAGGSLRLTGKVGKNVTVAGGSVIISRESTIGRNLLAAGGNLEISGSVAEEARIAAGDADLTGNIKGNVQAAVDRLTIHHGAVLGGNLNVFTQTRENVTVDSGTVAGTITFAAREAEHQTHILGMSSGRFWFRVVFFFSLIVMTLVLTFTLPSELKAYGEKVYRKAGWSALWGIVVLLVAPVAGLILCCTLIGAPLGLLIFTVYLWCLYLSQLSLGLLISGWLLRMPDRKAWGLFGVVTLGLLCIFILEFIPYLHSLLVIAGLILGTGALCMMAGELWKARRMTHVTTQPSATAP